MPVNSKIIIDSSGVRHYAIRRVNPFLGVMQIIETEGGRAMSTNGIVWDIEVRVEADDGHNIRSYGNPQLVYYRYGLWSLDEGLVNRPLSPYLENDPLTLKCNDVINCIRERHHLLPFDLIDDIELWLFDEKGQLPVALLATVIPGAKRPSPDPKYWTSCLGANGVPSQRRFPGATELEVQVASRASHNINNYWVIRDNYGGGAVEASGSYLSADAFPVFLLTEDWPESEQKKLASNYIDWISPSLLSLQHLKTKERLRLEKNLKLQAVSVEHHWHLYPEIIDEKHIKAARVQCQIEKANQSAFI